MSDNYVLQSSQNPDPTPDFSQVATDAMIPGGSPAPTTTSDVPNQIPTPDQGPSIPAEQAPPPGPQKPSLWRQVLSGALQGLAAGSQVNTRGMSGGSAFAAGAGAGANQVLNVQPQRQAALDQEKAQQAFHYAQLAHIQREMNLMPDDKREAYLNDAADTYGAMLKAGAVVPLSQPGDLVSAQQQLQALHAKNNWAVYSIMPVHGDDGSIQYSTVQYTKAPTQSEITLKGAGDDGEDITIPAGTPSDKVGMVYTNRISKQIEAETKTSIADNKNTTSLQVQGMKGAQAAAKAAANPNANMMVGSLPDGSQVAGTADELKAAGVSGITKLPAAEQAKTITARQLVAPGGQFSNVASDIADLNKRGQLGAVASRWNEFLTGKVGTGGDPMFARLSTDLGLLQTAIMQAHVGAKGGNEMLEHFKATVGDASISDAPTLLARLSASYNYVRHKAMLVPKSKGGQ